MNVKNKVISIVMSFIICFGVVSSSFANDKKSIEPLVFDGGIISAPMLATVSSLAVATGIVIKESDDIYDIGKMFYDYVERNNELTWDFVQSAFVAGHTLVNDVVRVDNNFLDIVKGFFNNTFDVADVDVDFNETTLGNIVFNKRIYLNGNYLLNGGRYIIPFTPVKGNEGFVEIFYVPSNKNVAVFLNVDGVLKLSLLNNKLSLDKKTCLVIDQPKNIYTLVETYSLDDRGTQIGRGSNSNTTPLIANGISFPYTGGYNWDNVKDKENEGSVALPIPGNLDSLVGQGSDTFWDNTDGLVGSGSISLPVVENPSIGVTDDVFVGNPSTDIPGVDSPGVDSPGIVFPPFGGGLDFTPITQSSFVDKFPFSLAKDIKNIVSVFDVEPKAPKFTVPIVSEELEIDLTQFNVWASIIRFFVLIGFMIALINITRKVIG